MSDHGELKNPTSLNERDEPLVGLEGPIMNGDLSTDNAHELTELVYHDREGSGAPSEISVRYSKSGDGEAECLLQKVD